MCPPNDWFDEIVAGDPLRPDPPERDRASGRGGRVDAEQHPVTEGFDDLFIDFDASAPGEPDVADEAAVNVEAAPPVDQHGTATGESPAEDADGSARRESPRPADPDVPAYAGEGWAGDEDEVPADAPWECDIDTSLVPPQEMTGVWLTTEADRESPLRMDGEPIEPEELDLPPEVADRLRDWVDQWRAEWDEAQGWRPRARIGDYEALGHWLARRVKDGAGPLDVTLQLAHLGRAGVERIEAAGRRRALVVRLVNRRGRRFPVQGDFVTDSGVGSFSAELNAKLEGWADHFEEHLDPVIGWDDPRAARDHAAFGAELAADMGRELGEDYRVELDLWELDGVLGAEDSR